MCFFNFCLVGQEEFRGMYSSVSLSNTLALRQALVGV